jgi:hypothetical protein
MEADIEITLAVAPKKRIWCNRIRIAGKSSHNAGQTPAGFTAHSGLVIALLHGVGWRNKSIKRLGLSNDPAIHIKTEDANFATAIRALVSGQKVTTLRSARSLFPLLIKSLTRGSVTVEVVPDADPQITSLRGWGINRFAIDRRLSPLFVPKLVSESQ